MSDDKEQIRELAGKINDANTLAGVLASVVADRLSQDDLEAARAALPAYVKARGESEELGLQMIRAAGLSAADDADSE